MRLTKREKETLKRELVECLSGEPEVRKVVVFGSFAYGGEFNDIDVAIFQDSAEKYLPLAMKYRGKLEKISDRIPLDVIPLKSGAQGSFFLDEIEQGEVIFER